MPFKDVLIALSTYPDPTPFVAIDQGTDFAATFNARISAIACAIEIRAPGHVLADTLLGFSTMAAAVTQKSAQQAEALLRVFEETARKRGVFQERILEHCLVTEVPNLLTQYARTKDLSIVPVPEEGLHDQWYAESVIFGSGRPTLVMPHTKKRSFPLNAVLIAWDFSRPAARAVADALPILRQAKKTSILIVTNEKNLDSDHLGSELQKHLQCHGIEAVLETVDAGGRSIGDVLRNSVESKNADLLVMGAFGHSRIRDFVLGGATKSMIAQPPIPIFLSH